MLEATLLIEERMYTWSDKKMPEAPNVKLLILKKRSPCYNLWAGSWL